MSWTFFDVFLLLNHQFVENVPCPCSLLFALHYGVGHLEVMLDHEWNVYTGNYSNLLAIPTNGAIGRYERGSWP